jgi:hypothetical protein
MTPARRPGRLTAWIAIFAILLAALAPGVARALSSSQKAMPWTDICAVAGTQGAPDLAPPSGSGSHDGGAFKHCPFCLTHAGHVALPTAPLVAVPEANARADTFPPSATPISPRFTRAAAQPRAPPANS